MTVDPLARAERIAVIARDLGIPTALIGAAALAVYSFVRATADVGFATAVDPYKELPRFQEALEKHGFHTRLNYPDDQDDLGGVLRIWVDEDEDGDPVDPIDIVNFVNPHRPRKSPAIDAIRTAIELERKPLRCVRLPDLVALKLDAGGRRDLADVVDVLKLNPDADREEIRATCKRYGFDVIDELIAEAG